MLIHDETLMIMGEELGCTSAAKTKKTYMRRIHVALYSLMRSRTNNTPPVSSRDTALINNLKAIQELTRFGN